MSDLSLNVSVSDNKAALFVEGRANFKCTESVKKFCSKVMADGVQLLQIDLSKCIMMDSTFMGILTGVGIEGKSRKISVQILNAGDANKKLLFDLGLKTVFDYVDTDIDYQDAQELEQEELTNEQHAVNVRDGHQNLIDVHEPNREIFQDILDFLNENP